MGGAVADEGIDAQSSTTTETRDADAHVDPRLEEAEGTEQVYLVLDQYDGSLSEDREEAITQLREYSEESQATARQEVTAMNGVELINTYWITNAIRAEVDADTVDTEELAAIDGVNTVMIRPEYQIPEPVDRNEEVPSSLQEDDHTYGLNQINASDTWEDFNARGEDVKVAVLDTGFDVSHQDLDLYTEDADDPTYPGGWVEIGPDGEPVEDSEPYDTHYHGTHVGGTVGADVPADDDTPAYGVAPGVDLQHALVLPGGSGASSDPIAGFEYTVEEMDTDVVSMSFGAGCGLFGPVYQDAWIPVIQNANDMGVPAVTSSGNSGEGCVGSPANIHDSFSIGASNADGDITDFSSGDTIAADNWDNPDPEWPDEWIKPDVAAPGEDVLSAEPGDGYQELDGTSMAAPHAAGTIALMLSANDELTAEEIQNTLEETAWKPDDWDEPGDEKDVRYGYGIIDAYAAVDEVGVGALEYDLGDVNQDESVNVQDVQLTQQYLQDMDPDEFNEDLGDLDRDGEVTTTDLNLLQYKVQGNLDEGEIAVSNLETLDEADQGETIEVTVDLENLGEEGAVQELGVHVSEDPDDLGDGEPVTTEVVDVAAPGVDDPVDQPAETTITIDVDTSEIEPGDYHIGVFSEDDSASDELTILGSHFAVSNLEAPDQADQGETVEVSADVENTGNTEDTQDVEFRFDDLNEPLLVEENVTLGAGEGTSVTFEVDTSDFSEGAYDHGVFSEDDEATTTITILEPYFDVEITDAPETVSAGESYTVDATVENTGDAPDEQEIVYDLGAGGGTVAVVDVAADTKQGEGIADVLNDSLDAETYEVEVVTAENLLDEMGDYDTFVVQRFGSDEIAEDFLDALEADQGAVYLDSYQGGSSQTYADGVYRLNNVRENPAERDSDATATDGEPVEIDIHEDHPIFAGVGSAGDSVEVYAGTTTWGAWFDDYDGTVLADADFSAGDDGVHEGPSIAVNDDENEVLATAVARDFFTDEPSFTEEGNQLLANAVEYATTGGVTADATSIENSDVVRLEPGESEGVTLSYTVPDDVEPGDANHIVSSEDDQDLAPVTIEDDTPTGDVVGTVVDDQTGDPIENATVELGTGDETYTDVTDVDGAYTLENVPAGEHEITVTAEGYAEKTDTVEVPEDGTITKDIGLHTESGAISGQVTASDDGAPVENATVVAENDDGGIYEATTDANGEYTLENVSAGTYVVNVADTPPGYQPDEIVVVEPGEHVEDVDFEIDRTAGAIEGYVTNAAGVPIEDAHVVDADGDAFNVTTNADGYYEIENVTPGTYALRAIADGYDDSHISFVEVDAGETTVENLTLGTYFEVSDFEAPDTASQGEEITVNATITNVGEREDTRTVFYFPPGTDFGGDVIDYEPEQSQTVTLEGGESTTVEFSYEIPEDEATGESTHGISADEVETAPITIEGDDADPDPAYFEVSDLDGPDSVQAGDELSVDATITNTGDEEGTETVFLFWDQSADGLADATHEELREYGPDSMVELTLQGGESETVTLTHAVDAETEPGTYPYTVSALLEMADDDVVVESAQNSVRPPAHAGPGTPGSAANPLVHAGA
ncbi:MULTISPECIES: carboxypeptidase regulatory-like domain-containing protein [Natrialbaceae]|uniref:carboxypeptidase regulatory-like domain-containing protein n=1 Tax=Natrialbaceae TaxID=1644061 RepID=UPI00207CEA37|nr:carboxypeptidase regulatory-like domain-containing protein [Natronococcus sp. CG52]